MQKQNETYPIDFVISWVDGSDPEWLAEKKKYTPPEMTADDRVSRYRDWDNLQYLFRGIEKFAPWVNNIYFVTWGHLPKWMNKDAPKLKIVRNKDFIPAEYEPTFSSQTKELNLHRINGLSEHFVSFDDDMFLLGDTRREDFFRNGKPCDCAVLTAHSHTEDKYFMFMEYRAAGLLNKYFNIREVIRNNRRGWLNLKYGCKTLFRSWVLSGFPRFTGIWQNHLAYSLCKSTYEELWEKEGNKFHQTCLNRFRNMTNFNIWVFRNWQLATGNFYPRSTKFGKKFETDDLESYKIILDYIDNRRGKIICINDSDPNISEENFIKARDSIKNSLNRILPDKSSFEM
jgi:hypothetical protein